MHILTSGVNHAHTVQAAAIIEYSKPFLPPVCLHIQREKAWEIWSHELMSGRLGGGGWTKYLQAVSCNVHLEDWFTSEFTLLCLPVLKMYITSTICFSWCQGWVDAKQELLWTDITPCVYCLSNWCHDLTRSPRPFPSVSIFAYCKQSKTWGGNDLGTRLHWIGNF